MLLVPSFPDEKGIGEKNFSSMLTIHPFSRLRMSYTSLREYIHSNSTRMKSWGRSRLYRHHRALLFLDVLPLISGFPSLLTSKCYRLISKISDRLYCSSFGKLRSVTIDGPIGDQGQHTTVEIHRGDIDTNVVRLIRTEGGNLTENVNQTTQVYRGEEKRKDVTKSEVLLVFPLTSIRCPY